MLSALDTSPHNARSKAKHLEAILILCTIVAFINFVRLLFGTPAFAMQERQGSDNCWKLRSPMDNGRQELDHQRTVKTICRAELIPPSMNWYVLGSESGGWVAGFFLRCPVKQDEAESERGVRAMPVTNYYTIDGSLIGEATAGVRTDYLTDALGSVTATVDSSGNLLNTYRYKPYGEQLAKTGIAADPKFTWVGSLGYRQTGRKHSDVHVRARHYGTSAGRWTTIDPIGINGGDINYFSYVQQQVTSFQDPLGLYLLFIPIYPPIQAGPQCRPIHRSPGVNPVLVYGPLRDFQ